MAKATLVAVVTIINLSFAWCQESTTIPACLADSLECESPSAALLQVERQQLKVSIAGDDDPITRTEMLAHTMPLQEQIDDVKERVDSLEGAVGKEKSKDKGDRSSDKHMDKFDRDYVKNDNSDNNDGDSKSKKKRKGKGDSSNSKGKDEGDGKNHMDDWAWPKGGKHKGDAGDDADNDYAHDRQGNNHSHSHSHGSQKENEKTYSENYDEDAPDWNGTAPRAWNGLEKVKGKGKEGRGVVTGKKYKGEYPYELLMDVDFIIDSNPAKAPESASAKAPEKYGGKTKPEAGAKSESKYGGKTKASPRNEGKMSPSRSQVSPKSSPIHGAKSKAAREMAKSSETSGGKAKSSGRSGRKSKSSGQDEASGKGPSKSAAKTEAVSLMRSLK